MADVFGAAPDVFGCWTTTVGGAVADVFGAAPDVFGCWTTAPDVLGCWTTAVGGAVSDVFGAAPDVFGTVAPYTIVMMLRSLRFASQGAPDVRESESQRIRESESQRVRESESQRVRGSESQRVRESESQRVRESESQRVRESPTPAPSQGVGGQMSSARLVLYVSLDIETWICTSKAIKMDIETLILISIFQFGLRDCSLDIENNRVGGRSLDSDMNS